MNPIIVRKKIEGLLKYSEFRHDLKNGASQNQHGIMLVCAPSHGNLGDHAISIAELQALQALHPELKYIDLTDRQTGRIEKLYGRNAPSNMVVAIHGGGFLGSLWPQGEYRFRRVLQAFPNNKIIVFPQTITFDMETDAGKEFLKESQKIYSSHSDLTVFVREKKSYALMQEYFPTVKCILVPDIVTLLDIPLEQKERSGILFCMRRDLEKTLDKDCIKMMQDAVRKKYPDEEILFTDTVIGDENTYIDPEDSEMYVTKKLEQFKGSKLVVTDRLHGMVFAALTDTPCIAMNNSNGKVRAVYDWIRGNEYIRFVDSVGDFSAQLESLDLEKRYHYNRNLVEKAFEPLFKELEGTI